LGKPLFTATKIRRPQRTTMPNKYMFLDVETYINKTKQGNDLPFRLAVTCYKRRMLDTKIAKEEWKAHYSLDELCTYFISKTLDKTVLDVFAHNIFFDLLTGGLLQRLTIEGWIYQFHHDSYPNFILTVRKEKATIRFISSTNHYACKLAALGKMLDLPKLDIDTQTDDMGKLLEYCKRDVEIVKLAMERHFDTIERGNLGGYRLTIGSQALAAFRTRFMEYDIYPCRLSEVEIMEDEAYSGGRVECFQRGSFSAGPFVKLDFNSAYAFVMRNNAYPTKYLCTIDNPTIPRLSELLEKYCVCARVVINTDVEIYPVRANHKLYFPIGEFKTTLCTKGLEEAIKRGHIVKVIRANVYDGRFIFKKYVDYFFGLKVKYQKEKNALLRDIYKHLLTNLYGKFGQVNEQYEETESLEGPLCYKILTLFADTNKRTYETKFMNKIRHKTGEKKPVHTSKVIAAHVTENTRYYLWEIIESIGLSKILYCDTDCVICRKKDMHPVDYLIDPNKLGFLDIEKETLYVDIRAPKDYTLGLEEKRKGIPGNAIKIGHNKWKYEEFPTLHKCLVEGDILNAHTKTMIRTLTYKDTKRKYAPNGTSVPYRLPDDVFLLG